MEFMQKKKQMLPGSGAPRDSEDLAPEQFPDDVEMRYIHTRIRLFIMLVQLLHSWLNSVMHFDGHALRSAPRSLRLRQVLGCLTRKVAFCVCVVFHCRTMKPISRWHVWNFTINACSESIQRTAKGAKQTSENTAANSVVLLIEMISAPMSNSN